MLDRAYIVEKIQAYCGAETTKDRAAFMALFSPEIVHEDPVGIDAAKRVGFEKLGELWDMAMRGDVNLWVDTILVCGLEAVAIMGCETGPADKRRKTAPIVDVFTFNADGKIIGVRAFYEY